MEKNKGKKLQKEAPMFMYVQTTRNWDSVLRKQLYFSTRNDKIETTVFFFRLFRVAKLPGLLLFHSQANHNLLWNAPQERALLLNLQTISHLVLRGGQRGKKKTAIFLHRRGQKQTNYRLRWFFAKHFCSCFEKGGVDSKSGSFFKMSK